MKKMLTLGLVLMFFSVNSYAIDVGLGARAGINGLGVDLSVGLTKNVNLRLIGAAVDIDSESETVTVGDSGAEGDIDAELDFDYGATAALIDWHVFGGGFRISAGMFKSNSAIDFSGTLQSDIVVDGQLVQTTDLGEISGGIDLADSYKPYLGVGWGRGAGGDGGLTFMFDVGVALVDPSVNFEATATGAGLSQAELDDALAGMEKDAEDDLDDLELWPVLSIGLNYAF